LVDVATVSEELTLSIFRVENEPRDKIGMARRKSGLGISLVPFRQSITVLIIGVIFLVQPSPFLLPLHI
jgi:hypothetical protein